MPRLLRHHLGQSSHARMIVTMPRTCGGHTSGNVATEQREVSNAVEHLVTGTFVREMNFVIDDARIAEDEEVFRRGPAPQTLAAQRLDFRLQHERPAGRKLLSKRLRRDGSGICLWRNGGGPIVENEPDLVLFAHGRLHRHADQRTVIDQDRVGHVADGTRSGLLDDARPIDRFDEGGTASVTSGRLRSVQADKAVIDTQTGEGGHHVFDHLDAHSLPADDGSPWSRLDEIDESRNLHRIRSVTAFEDNSVVFRRGKQFEADVRTSEEAEPFYRHGALDRLLPSQGAVPLNPSVELSFMESLRLSRAVVA